LTRIRHITVALFALAMLAVTAPAAQADYHQAIKDCYDDGVLQGTYTPRELRQARNHLPSSISEYSDCADVLARALAAATHKGKGGRGGGDPFLDQGDPKLTTPSGAVAKTQQQFDALNQQTGRSAGAPPKVSVGRDSVTPGTAGLIDAAARTSPNHLPGPLLAALIALGAMGALAGGLVLRHRWPETRRVALRLLRR
jgi:hypothetical protein